MKGKNSGKKMINSGLRLLERPELSMKSKAQYFLFIPSFSIL
jgi:hypothetical protein